MGKIWSNSISTNPLAERSRSQQKWKSIFAFVPFGFAQGTR